MSAYIKFNQFVEDLCKKVHNLDTDTLKLMLTDVAPNAATAKVKTDITEIAPGNGYAAGGTQAAFVSGAQTAGTFKLVLGQVTFTAAGGSIGPFRYIVLYNATANAVIGYYDYGAEQIITDGNSFLAALDQTNGVIQLS